jgi:hypothetical protein
MANIIGFQIVDVGMIKQFYAMDEAGQLWILGESSSTPGPKAVWERFAKPIVGTGTAGPINVDLRRP